MNSILCQKVYIENHPVKSLTFKLKNQYVNALIAYVKYVLKSQNTSMMICNEWCSSIMGTSYESLVKRNVEGDLRKYINEGLTLKRIGFSFFRMKHQFFFDAFYLIFLSNDNDQDRVKYYNDAYFVLKNEFSNIFTRKSLDNSYRFFVYQAEHLTEKRKTYTFHDSKMPLALRKHYYDNIEVISKSWKRILVVANVSAGKSTLINALIGKRINESRTTACTSRLNYIYSSKNPGMTILKNDRYYFSDFNSYYGSDEFVVGATDFKGILKNNICIIDTPGMNNAEDKKHGEITAKAIEETDGYDIAVYVCNCQYFGTTDEKYLLTKLIKTTKDNDIPVIFVLNQLDKFNPKEDSVEKMLREYELDLNEMGIANPVVIPVSSRYAMLLRTGVDGEDEEFELNQLKRKFEKDYFNLPKYLKSNIGSQYSNREDYKSGICCLENVILNNL